MSWLKGAMGHSQMEGAESQLSQGVAEWIGGL